jgi:PAS domain S-box-containing protein
MIWVTDAQGGIEFVNQAYRAFFGVREQDLRGPDGWKPLVHPDDVQTYADAFYACLRDRLPFYAEARMRRQDGQWRWIASYAAPRLAADGRIIGYAGSSPDITEMREAVAHVREAMKVKDEFLASVAHELRQPINAALAAIGLMRAQHDTDAGGRASVVLERQLRQMSRVVDDLLEASRIVRGDVALTVAEVDLRVTVRDALDTAAPAFDERHHHLEVALPDEAVVVCADAARIQQVLVNVLSNAAKYTPDGGSIRVAMHPTADRVAIHVRDSGIGIPPEALTRIFDLFARSAAGRGHRGFGIGLAVARQLMEQHGGTIEARSDGSGAGSEFVVSLPVHRPRS